jgi:regulator of RNase E activity RraB
MRLLSLLTFLSVCAVAQGQAQQLPPSHQKAPEGRSGAPSPNPGKEAKSPSEPAGQWGSYFDRVNDKPASIAVDLSLRAQAPMSSRPQLLLVSVNLQSPKPNGLSDNVEFKALAALEDDLVKSLRAACGAVQAGRVTTDGRREFYFYGTDDKSFRAAVSAAMRRFSTYKFDMGSRADPGWGQYLNTLYPSEETSQRMQNMSLLGTLLDRGDTLRPVRDVHHWIYFRAPGDRQRFAAKARTLNYRITKETEDKRLERAFGLHITRDQSVTPDQIDAAVIELFRLAKEVDAKYDGWEARVVAPSKR